jgi:hypothetical protein
MRRYAVKITSEDIEHGFDVKEHRPGLVIVVKTLQRGLFAVKIQGDDGEIAYVVCNHDLAPLYPAARSLDELERRFGK